MIVVKDPNERQAAGVSDPSAARQHERDGAERHDRLQDAGDQRRGRPKPHRSPGSGEAPCRRSRRRRRRTSARAPASPGPPANPYPIDENGSLRGPFAAGDIPNIQTALHAGRTNEGQTVLTNGMNVGGRAGHALGARRAGPRRIDAQRAARPGAATADAQRLRGPLLPPAPDTPTGTLIPLVRVGGEGGLLNNAVLEGGLQGTFDTRYDAGEILLPPGSRADVVAAIPSSPTSGVLTMWTEDYQRTGSGYSDIPTVPVAHFKLAGSPGIARRTRSPAAAAAPPSRRPARRCGPRPAPGPRPGAADRHAARTRRRSPRPSRAWPRQNIQLTQNGQTDLGDRRHLRHPRRLRQLHARPASGLDALRRGRRHPRAARPERDRARTTRSTCTASRCSRCL